jgi:hypothetical protein
MEIASCNLKISDVNQSLMFDRQKGSSKKTAENPSMTSITDSSHALKILRPIIQTNARTLSRFIPAKAYPFDVEVRTQTLSSHWRIGRIFEAV